MLLLDVILNKLSNTFKEILIQHMQKKVTKKPSYKKKPEKSSL